MTHHYRPIEEMPTARNRYPWEEFAKIPEGKYLEAKLAGHPNTVRRGISATIKNKKLGLKVMQKNGRIYVYRPRKEA